VTYGDNLHHFAPNCIGLHRFATSTDDAEFERTS